MISKDVLLKILWSTIEDFVGLWEINWELNVIQPNNDNDTNKILSRKIIDNFISNDLVTLYFFEWGGQCIREIPIEEASCILNEERYWNAPFVGEKCVKVGCKEKGKIFYEEERVTDLVF